MKGSIVQAVMGWHNWGRATITKLFVLRRRKIAAKIFPLLYLQDLESKSQSLQLTVDRLSLALTKSEELESASKDKMQQMNISLTDHSQTIEDLQQRLAHLQKALTTSEQDRRIAQVCYEIPVG